MTCHLGIEARGQYRLSRNAKGVLAAAGASLGMATGFGSLVLGAVFMTALEADLGWTRSQISLGYAVCTAGMAIGGLFWGRISDRVNLVHILSSGGFFVTLPLVVFAVMTSLWQYLGACFALGILGFGALYPPLISACGEWFPVRRGLVVGIVTAGGALGQGAMPYLADRLILASDWRSAFWALAAIVAVAQIFVAMTVRRVPEDRAILTEAARPCAQDNRVFTPRLVALSAAAFMCCACMGMPLIHLAGYVSVVCGSTSFGATTMFLAMICGAVGRVFFGLIADRIGNIAGYMLASAIQTACLIAFPWIATSTGLLTIAAIFGFGFAGNMTCIILCIRDEVPAARFGAALGPVMFIAWAGMGVGGLMGGILYDATLSYQAAFIAAAAFGFANLAILASLVRRDRDTTVPRISRA